VLVVELEDLLGLLTQNVGHERLDGEKQAWLRCVVLME
jgi:hypothetical protein